MSVNGVVLSAGQQGHDLASTATDLARPRSNPAAFRDMVDGRTALDQGRQILDEAQGFAEENCRSSATGCGPAPLFLGLALGFAGAFDQLTEWGDDLGEFACDLTGCDEPEGLEDSEGPDGAEETENGTEPEDPDLIEQADADAKDEAPADEGDGIVGRTAFDTHLDAGIDDATGPGAGSNDAWR